MTNEQYAKELLKRLGIRPAIVKTTGIKTRKHQKINNYNRVKRYPLIAVKTPTIPGVTDLLQVMEGHYEVGPEGETSSWALKQQVPSRRQQLSHPTGSPSPLPPDPLFSKIGKRIKLFREQRHLSQEELAEKAGIAEASTVSRHERGSHITIQVLEKYAEAMDLELSDFFPRNRPQISIVEAFRNEFRLSDKRMKIILTIIEDWNDS